MPQNNAALSDSQLPAYAAPLAAYHRAFESDLRAMLDNLPIRSGARVLDIGCGDGFYLPLLAELPAVDSVVGVDIDSHFLEIAQQRCSGITNIELIRGGVPNLPFADQSFDFMWCAQSLYSLPSPSTLIREALRILRPGGKLAVFENDTLHHLILPWPADLELELRRAEMAGYQEESENPGRFYVARHLPALCRKNGLVPVKVYTYTHTRSAPFTPDERCFFDWYLEKLRERIVGRLDASVQEQFDLITSPNGDRALLSQTDTTVVCLNYVVVAKKAAGDDVIKDASK